MLLMSDLMGGGIKSVQAGSVLAAGTVTITSVNTAKTFVISVSKGSAGYVAARGTVTLAPIGLTQNLGVATGGSSTTPPSYTGPITGGTTDLTVAAYSGKLISSTQLQCDGPCEYQVVEFR